MLNKEAAKIIRHVVAAAGYEFSSSFNDKLAKTRRIKMMINGYDFGPNQYDAWDETIRKELDRRGVPYLSAGFVECSSYRGPYWAYCVVLRLDGIRDPAHVG